MNQNLIWLKFPAILIVTVFVFNVFAPVVEAQTGPGKSGEVVSHQETVVIEPDDSANWTAKLNVANGTDYRYLDYNLTWIPFFENNTDLQGIVVHSVLAPMQFTLNATHQEISTGSFFRLTPDTIMDGASEVWFRLPVLNIPINATIRVRVARVADPSDFNLSFATLTMPVFNDLSDVQTVSEITLDTNAVNLTLEDWFHYSNSWIGYKRWLNLSAPSDNGTYYYNFTYVKSCFGLFPNEWYFIEFDVLAYYAHDMKLCFSPSDFGDDGRYNSWVWLNGTSYYFPVDMDTAFVCTYGVSNGITGIGARMNHRAGTSGNEFNINASIPIGQTINATVNHWFNFAVPMFLNTSAISKERFRLYIDFYSSFDDSVLFYHTWFGAYGYTIGDWDINTGYAKLIDSVDLSAYNGVFLDHIRFDIVIQGWGSSYQYPANATEVKLWGTQKAKNWSFSSYGGVYNSVGFTDLYWVGYIGTFPTPGWKWSKTMYEKQWFVPFGYFGLDTWYFTLTNQTIVVIPVHTPSTPEGILEKMQQFEAWLTKGNRTEKGIFDSIMGFFTWLTKKILDLWVDLVDWVCGLPVIRDIINALNMAFNVVFKFFYGIALWFWDVLIFVFEALEWFTYWAVRLVYSFSLIIVYVVNIFGVISINAALLAVVRTGNGKDFVKAFRAGWNFVFAIISLLLSLAIMAISIVAAVVPF